jgi:DNA-binding NarL/FixJ family response regulator
MGILIVDDHEVVRRGLRDILADEFAEAEFGEAGNAQDAYRAVQAHPWDAVILDISMPGESGLDLLAKLHATHPTLPVLVLSMHPEDQFALRVLEAGAAGYITKDKAPEALVEAVREVLAGRKYLSPSAVQHLVRCVGPNPDRPAHGRLSARESQVLRLIASGKRLKEIAEELSLSIKTVSTYKSRIFEKTGAANLAELIGYAVRQGIVQPG